MRILILGAYGLIGSHVTARLLRDGHRVVGAGRDIAAAARRVPRVRWVHADLGTMTAEGWQPVLAGVDAVVNCAGALQDGPRDDLRAVHVTGLLALAQACIAAGVRRFVQISAAGLNPHAGAFTNTKHEADAALAALDLDWVILRPGLVLAPTAYGGSALLRGLAAFPLAMPVIHADAIVQVVSVDDVAEAVAQSVRPDGPARITCDLVAGEATSLRDIVQTLRSWLGLRPAPVISLPPIVGRLTGHAADALAWLGWRSPMRNTAMAQLAAGVRGRSADAPECLGFSPRTLGDMLAQWPSGVQERWFARLYFLKPLVLAMLALFWIASGLIGLAERNQAAQLLTAAGFDMATAQACVTGGAMIDLALGILVGWRRAAPWALAGMLAVTAGYLVGATLWRPDLWLDPLGPLVKTIPAAVLALVGLALMDER